MKFDVYDPQNGPFYDETFAARGVPRPGFEPLVNGINALEPGSLLMRQAAAERALLSMGITFTLYGDGGGDGGSAERIFPFDVIPRVVGAKEWERIDRGLRQRIEALNLFLCDVYGEQKILKDKVVPEALVKTCADFRPQCIGLK
ncbi:MAG TPA: circularly permuted type 2 ATP-grasp protein, partial [Polyangiaceae bacterium]